jgi:hypothetical protein
VNILAWTQTVLLALLCNSIAQAQTPIPKELEGWQSWVQDGHEFRHCPFFAKGPAGRTKRSLAAPAFALPEPTPDPSTFKIEHPSDADAYKLIDELNAEHKIVPLPFPLPRGAHQNLN